MKRFMLFGYDTYYPCGGMNDFIDSYDTLEELEKDIKSFRNPCDYYDAYDLTDGRLIQMR